MTDNLYLYCRRHVHCSDCSILVIIDFGTRQYSAAQRLGKINRQTVPCAVFYGIKVRNAKLGSILISCRIRQLAFPSFVASPDSYHRGAHAALANHGQVTPRRASESIIAPTPFHSFVLLFLVLRSLGYFSSSSSSSRLSGS